jgi:hypothetical protein
MPDQPEPWLRGTRSALPAVIRAVLHALDLAEEDLEMWAGLLTDEELYARPLELTAVCFHVRHIARSIDRLLTYAEECELNAAQLLGLKSELDTVATREEVLGELRVSLQEARTRITTFRVSSLEEPRYVGKLRLPTTLGGLLVHVADHTQRHVGQAVTGNETFAGIATFETAMSSPPAFGELNLAHFRWSQITESGEELLDNHSAW